MEAVIAAIMGDLASRSISFLIDSYIKPRTGDDDDESRLVGRLHQLLLRLQVIIEEAEQRRVTNHAMLRQLGTLREQMYRGHHALDTHRHHKHKDDDDNDGDQFADPGGGGALVSHTCFATKSQSSPAKRVRLMMTPSSPRRSEERWQRRRLQQVVARLETTIADVKDEFVVFLVACPLVLPRQPYSVHLVMDRCMFGRQMEMERVIAFLLQPEEDELGILPIVGPKRSGKTTLVEHACNDERVREHFSQIVSFTFGDLKDEENIALTLASGRVIRNQQLRDSQALVIIELNGDKNSMGLDGGIMVDLFRRFCSMCRSRAPRASKIIVTSRSDKIIASLGITEHLRLDYLTQEAYWYFFKARAFGSVDASEHPEMVSIALDIAAEANRSFTVVESFGGLLRSNFNARFWRFTLAVLPELVKKQQLFLNMNDARHIDINSKACKQEFSSKIHEKLICYDDGLVEGDVPKISMKDIIFGGARPKGRFDVLGWKSSIPPYHTYGCSCEIQRNPQLNRNEETDSS